MYIFAPCAANKKFKQLQGLQGRDVWDVCVQHVKSLQTSRPMTGFHKQGFLCTTATAAWLFVKRVNSQNNNKTSFKQKAFAQTAYVLTIYCTFRWNVNDRSLIALLEYKKATGMMKTELAYIYLFTGWFCMKEQKSLFKVPNKTKQL